MLTLLQHRRSSKQFGDQAPNSEQLEQILKAGLRVPDHGRMKPYHFVVIEKSGMPILHECFKSAAIEFEMDEKNAIKADKLANQAPMIIGVVAKLDHDSEKVPAWEQMISAGCAAYAMQLAANAQGFDTVWISKKWVEGSALRQAFGCTERDKVIGLLLIGSPKEGDAISFAKETENPTAFVSFIR